MSNSITIFSNRLKKAYNDKKRSLKDSGGKYSKEEFAKNVYGVGTDGKVHVDRVNKWFQGKNFPSPDLIPEIAKELDCDIAYLFGEIECKHCKEQQITEITGLSAEGASTLINLSDWNKEILNKIIINKRFNKLIECIGDYCYPSTFLAINALKTSEGIIPGATAAEIVQHRIDTQNIHKFNASDRFNRILDDISEEYMNKEKKRYNANHSN